MTPSAPRRPRRLPRRFRPPGRFRPPVLVLVPALALVAVVGGALVLLNPRPDDLPRPSGAPAAFAPPASPLVVQINRAIAGPAHVGYPDRVSVSALGMGGVAAVELWSGGDRLELATTTDPSRPSATARWSWTPRETGVQVFVARAYDAAGRSAQSAALRVNVVAEPPRVVQLLEEPALDGETLEAAATRFGIDQADLRSDNEDLLDGPLAAGTMIIVRRTVDLPPPAAAGGALDLADAALVADTAPVLALGLATPQLDLAVDDCTVEATASGGGTESVAYAFSVLPPVGDTFVPMDAVAPDDDGAASSSFLALAGLNLVTVSSYDAAATAPSAIVPIVVPPECGSGWTGDASLVGGKLVVPGTADRAYLYLRVGDSAWERVPAGGGFVTRVAGALDFSAHLPALGQSDLGLEAWGWVGGSLVKLGAGQYAAPKEELYSGGLDVVDPLLGIGTSLSIVLKSGYDPLIYSGPTKENESEEILATHATADRPTATTPSVMKKFKWATTVAGVTKLVVQVLPYPLGTTSTTLTPPFLIDSKTISVQDIKTGYFDLDLKPYILGSISATWSTQALGEQLIGQLGATGAYGPEPTKAPANALIEPGSIWFPQPSATPSGGSTGGSAGAGSTAFTQEVVENLSAVTELALSSIYVRVIPFVATSPVPNASNSVVFDIVEPGEPFHWDDSPKAPAPTYLDAYTMEASFVAPTGSKKAYYHCVIVVETTDWLQYYGYPLGGKVCPPEPDDGWSIGKAFESFASWVGDVWDFASNAYSWVKEQIVNAVLLVVPCETIATTATNADDEDAKATCKVIAKTALDAALATFGIPPEIPNWKSLLTAAKGDLKTFILEEAKTIPGVSEACLAADAANEVSEFTTCEELIDEAIDEILVRIAKERSDAAAKYVGGVPDGVLVEPHPLSMPQPPHFVVSLTRTSAPLPAGYTCEINASMKSRFGDGIVTRTWHEYQWTDGVPKDVTKGPTEVTGEPYLSTKHQVIPLNPGESSTFEIWLSKPNEWFEPDGYNSWYAEQWAKWNESSTANHSWVLLQQGATVTGKLSSNCTIGGENVQVLSGQAAS